MTQEWFESADFEKTAINDKKESPSDPVIPEEELKEKEELPVVEENPQARKSRGQRTRRTGNRDRTVRRAC